MDVTSSSVVSPFRFAVDFPIALASSYESTSNLPGTDATFNPPQSSYTRDSLIKYTFGAISSNPFSFDPSFVSLARFAAAERANSKPFSPSGSTKYTGTSHDFVPSWYPRIVSSAASPS